MNSCLVVPVRNWRNDSRRSCSCSSVRRHRTPALEPSQRVENGACLGCKHSYHILRRHPDLLQGAAGQIAAEGHHVDHLFKPRRPKTNYLARRRAYTCGQVATELNPGRAEVKVLLWDWLFLVLVALVFFLAAQLHEEEWNTCCCHDPPKE